VESLRAELEASCLRALRATWHAINDSYFRERLTPPSLELSDADSRLGLWEPTTRTIQISRKMLLERDWGVVVEVLKHEMAHQFVWEILGERDETAHGPRFQRLCEELGIDGSAAGAPASDERAERIVARVTKLLALAQSPNEHEARAAMAAAQRLMLRHNLDVVGTPGAPRRYGHRHLGAPTGRVPEGERVLAGLLGQHFFVECIWVPVWRPREGKRGSVLEICGTPENLEMAAHVHSFLLGTAERLWREYRRERRLRSDRDRRTFVAGVMSGFKETLERQQVQNESEALVWVGDADLHRFYRRRHPHVRTTYYSASPPSTANADGRAAGRRIVLHKPVTASSGGGRLLGPGSSG
jgi:predicted SprT family Zn-dependent metalloprotease